jgi:proteasome lid subunit RPN8/RPN11
MKHLFIPRSVAAEMIVHSIRTAPVEACGILAGLDGRVGSFYRMTNVDNSPEHFQMDPVEQFAVQKKVRAEGLEMLAIFHSHPSSPARPSLEDLRFALTPGMVYVILSLQDRANPDIRGFQVEEGNVTPTPLNVEPALAYEYQS